MGTQLHATMHQSAQSAQQAAPLRLGVVGAASAGGWLQGEQGPEQHWMRLTAVCDINETAIAASRQQNPHIHHYTDYREMVKDPDIDLIYVTTPNKVHAEITIAALLAGKHVFCEKPMAITREDCAAMLRAERDSGKRLGIDFELRYSYLTGTRPKEIIDSGEIGEIRHMHLYHCRGGWMEWGNGYWRVRPEQVGGLALMETCHPLDLMRYWNGEITAVQAFKAPNVLQHYQIPDNTSSFLFFENGALGEITEMHTRSAQQVEGTDAQWQLAGHEDTFSIVGTKGSLRIDIWKHTITVLHFTNFPHGTDGMRVDLARVESCEGISRTRAHHDTPGYFQDFARRLALGEAPLMTAEDSFRTHIACFATEESALNGSQRIELDYSW